MPNLRAVLERLRWNDKLRCIDEVPVGFSGSTVYRVAIDGQTEDDQAEYAVKRLPTGTDRHRMMRIHQTVASMRTASIERGCGDLGLPEYECLVEAGEGFWEVSRWQPGQPLSVDANVDQIIAGVQAIAAVHRASHRVQRPADDRVAPSVLERIRRLNSVDLNLKSPSELTERYCRCYPGVESSMRAEFLETLRRAIWTLEHGWPIVGPGILRRLESWASEPTQCHFVIRDVHRMHLLFEHDPDQRIGFIDFDAMRIDTPALDLARWIGSFADSARPDPDAIWDRAVAEYDCENPFPNGCNVRRMDWVRLLHESGVWGSLVNWVDWVHSGRRFGSSQSSAGLRLVTERIRQIADAAAATIPV